MSNKFHFDRVLSNLQRVKSDLPKVLANDTKNFFIKENFDKQQFDGRPWEEPERKSKTGASTRLRSATLVQSGKLRRAVVRSLEKADWGGIIFRISDIVYAAVHNDGLEAGRIGGRFVMPKRQYIGDSKDLRVRQLSKIKKYVDKIWRV